MFVLLVSRYILQVGYLHGLEHYLSNLVYAPLRLPQRIRTAYMPASNLTDYYNRVDALNGVFGHRIYTRFHAGPPTNCDDWSTIRYCFMDDSSQRLASTYIVHVQQMYSRIRDTIVPTCRDLWDKSNVDITYDREYLRFEPRFLGISISI